MNVCKPALGAASLLLVLAGCVTIPNGPSQMVLPGSGRNFDEFRTDDLTCRQYAHDQIGGRTGQVAAEDSGVRSAAIGTLIGAAAGAAINGGTGAAVGAGAGLAMGGLAGTSAAEASAPKAAVAMAEAKAMDLNDFMADLLVVCRGWPVGQWVPRYGPAPDAGTRAVLET